VSERSRSVRDRARRFLPAGPALVALSGGADSAVAAWVASAEGVAPLRAVFVDHGLAGSPTMAEAARAVAAALGLTLTEVAVTVPAGPSPEDQARRVRRDALEGAAAPGEAIVTGHTGDDQAETVLGNLLRGGGVRGLAGMRPRSGRWYRPLLGVSRADTRALAAELDLPFRDDPANDDPAFRRNRLRGSLIPYLEAAFNPDVRAALARTARAAAADDAALAAAARRHPVPVTGGAALLPVAVLVTVDEAVAARVVRRGLRAVRGPHAGTRREVTAILGVARGAAPRASLGGGFLAEREGPYVVIHRGHHRPGSGPPPAADLPVPGSVAFGRFTIAARLDPPGAPAPLSRRAAVVDAAVAGDGLRVRGAEPGDRIAIAGGSKPVADALAEAGIPARLRSHWPVVEARGTIAWVPAARVAAGAAPQRADVPRVRLESERDGWWT
jgi:tRNA(Ile)-lysidine synthase